MREQCEQYNNIYKHENNINKSAKQLSQNITPVKLVLNCQAANMFTAVK